MTELSRPRLAIHRAGKGREASRSAPSAGRKTCWCARTGCGRKLNAIEADGNLTKGSCALVKEAGARLDDAKSSGKPDLDEAPPAQQLVARHPRGGRLSEPPRGGDPDGLPVRRAPAGR